MRKELSLVVMLSLVTASISLPPMAHSRAVKTHLQQTDAANALTNDTVVTMLKEGLAPEIVVAKIKNSLSNFDTSPAALQSLKQAGVPAAVMLAMVEAPVGQRPATTAVQPPATPVEINIPDGTELEVGLLSTLSGQEAKVGDVIDFTVLRPVEINGRTMIAKGAPARARVTMAKKSGHWGKAGKLEWAMQDVQAVDGSRVPVRFTKRAVGDSKGGMVAVAAVATTVLLGPIGLLFGLKKGQPALIPAGNRYTVFVHGDTTIKAQPSTAAAAKPAL